MACPKNSDRISCMFEDTKDCGKETCTNMKNKKQLAKKDVTKFIKAKYETSLSRR